MTQETQGNGLVTQRAYSGIFPALIGLQSSVQATGYWWNGLLNLTQRSDSQVSEGEETPRQPSHCSGLLQRRWIEQAHDFERIKVQFWK